MDRNGDSQMWVEGLPFSSRMIEWQWKMDCIELGGGFKYLLFSPLPGEDSHFE